MNLRSVERNQAASPVRNAGSTPAAARSQMGPQHRVGAAVFLKLCAQPPSMGIRRYPSQTRQAIVLCHRM